MTQSASGSAVKHVTELSERLLFYAVVKEFKGVSLVDFVSFVLLCCFASFSWSIGYRSDYD